jgi:dienelactone hydrolase
MPDMFENDPASNQTSSTLVEETDLTIIEQIKLQLADVAKSFVLDMWLARHTPEKVRPILHNVIEGARDEFADAVASGAGIYCVGYCFGAKCCLQLARESPEIVPGGQKIADEEAAIVKNGPYIKAGAIAHGTLITKEDFEGLKFPQEILDQGEQYMKDNDVPHEIKIYPKVPHGQFSTLSLLRLILTVRYLRLCSNWRVR